MSYRYWAWRMYYQANTTWLYILELCLYLSLRMLVSHENLNLRVPVCPPFRDGNGRCVDIGNDAAFLNFIGERLPVPRVKAYDSMGKNALGSPWSIQTRLPGISLDNTYRGLDFKRKSLISNQFVDLLSVIELITFPTAGTFMAASSSLPDRRG